MICCHSVFKIYNLNISVCFDALFSLMVILKNKQLKLKKKKNIDSGKPLLYENK